MKNVSVGALVLVASVLGVAGAAAGEGAGDRQTFEASFTTSQPDSPTGLHEAIEYVNPSNRRAKPFAVRKVVLRLAPGADIDTSVPARCRASDAQLIAQGASACPRASRVGGGEVDLDSGFPGPGRIVRTDVLLFNSEEELILLLEEEQSGQRTVSRADVRGRTFRTTVPPLPGGPPDGFTAIKRVRLDIRSIAERRGPGVAGYLETPSSCPARGAFVNEATFTYRDGVEQSERSASRCRAEAGGHGGDTSGTSRDDVLVGTPGDDHISCGSGHDRVDGRGGHDVIDCGSGNDVVIGGSGDDRVHGGSGDDVLRGGSGDDVLLGESGDDRLLGGPGRDRLSQGSGQGSTTQ